MPAKAIAVCTFLLLSTISLGAATYQTLYSFTDFEDGGTPFAGVIFDQYGNLYGVAAYSQTNEGTIFKLTPSQNGWNFDVLHGFEIQDTEGSDPIGGLVMDEAGNLYGTGSIVHGPTDACGSVFKLSSQGFTVLHYFYAPEGCDPESNLSYINGRIWGTTRSGGSQGLGAVFSIDTSGASFHSDSFRGKKGREPLGGINLWGYGTTFSGGGSGKGNVYRLDPAMGFISTHSFQSVRKAGYAPKGDLLTRYVGGVRIMYGTTSAGGVGGGGTVYRLTETAPNSERWLLSILHSFFWANGEGWSPQAGLTTDSAGNLYGTTFRGGEGGSDCGTVFKLSPGKSYKWTFTVLHSFDASQSEGCLPTSGVVLDSAGNLYGTTSAGGDFNVGTVYEIIP